MTTKDLSRVYPDEYLVEEDQMGNSAAQGLFIRYMVRVLEWLYRVDKWMIAAELNHYHTALNNSEKMIVPDIAVFKGINIPLEEQPKVTSWDMRKGDKACPPLVIEACSPSTYQNDIEADKKPQLYGLIGVKEYFAYDPNPTPLWPETIGGRLLGWKYDAQGKAEAIKANPDGRLWSAVLECWLQPDGIFLRLFDTQGQPHLTAEEAEAEARQSAESAKEKAWAKLRELGIDPETL